MAEEQDSYSLEAEANMETCLENLIEGLKSVGSADAYKNALFGIKLMVDKKQRRLSDLSSIGPGPVPRSLELMVFSRELIPQIVKEIKASGFRNVQANEVLQKVVVVVPKPTLEELQQVADEVARITRSTIGQIAKIKSNSAMRLKAGLENEYIDPPTAGKATKKLDNLFDKFAELTKLYTIKKRKDLLGKEFEPENKEEIELLEKLKKKKLKD
jgi:ribosome recycling factor